MNLKENYQRIRSEIPSHVTLVVAVKQRSPNQVTEMIGAGATDIGENYVQEAQRMIDALGEKAKKVKWHMIGELQTNKINKALPVFDMIQTVDSVEKAEAMDKRVAAAGKKKISCLIEVNIAGETCKSGAKGDYDAVEQIARRISTLDHLRLEGLMTMGPLSEDPEESRPYFKAAKTIFDQLKSLSLPNGEMKTLSMGMSASYKAAIEEGANMVRLGTALFGPR
ncbi:MAG: YggS family pyridoxal phosphate-dependent enzyme [Candidatus Omnitrophota bacterium]